MSLRSKALGGFVWSSMGTLGNGLVSFLVTIILARILSPADFALIALLTVFVTASNVIIDGGFAQAIIRDDDPSEKDLSSVFWLNMTLSLGLYVVLFCLSPCIAKFYDAPELVVLSRVVFLVVIFNAFTLIQNATLKRSLLFAKVEQASVLGAFIAGGIAVALACVGGGIWALVANMVLMPFFRSIFLWCVSPWRPQWQFDLESVKKYLSFGVFLTLQNLLDVLISNLTTLFIGRVYTKSDLGYYSQAGKLDYYIATPLMSVLDKVIYPIFSKVKNEAIRLKDGYRQVIGIVLFGVLPVMIFILSNAEQTIVFFFGEQWQPSAIYLQFLAILCLFQIIHRIFVNVILIKGKTSVMLSFAIIKQSLRLLAFFLTVHQGVVQMVVGFVVSGIIGSLLYIGVGMYYLNYTLIELFRDNYKTIIATIVSVGATMLLGKVLSDEGEWLLFVCQVIGVIILYVGFNLLLKNKTGEMVLGVLRSLIYKMRK